MIMFRSLGFEKAILNLPIKKKFFISYIAIIVFMALIIGSVSTVISTSRLVRKVQEMAIQLVYHVSVNIDYKSSNFEKFSYSMVNDPVIKKIFKNNMKSRNLTDTIRDASELGTAISKSVLFNSDIQTIYICTENKNVFCWNKDRPKLDVNQLTKEESKAINSLVEAARKSYNGISWSNLNQSFSDVFFTKKVIDTDNLDTLGYIIYKLDPRHFELSSPYEESLIKAANIAVLNAENEVIISNNSTQIIGLVQRVLADERAYGDIYKRRLNFNNNRYIVARMDTKYSKWKVLCFIHVSDILKGTQFIWFGVFITCIISIIAAGLIALILSGNVTRNIKLLEENMSKVEEGDLSVRIVPHSYDEIGLLGLKFNYMVDRINELINTVTKERLEKQKAEYLVLRSQINPHFLYNTLGSIKWLACKRRQTDIEEMLTSLIELLKAALGRNGERCTVGEELNYVDNYLTLQKIRYEECFKVEYNIDADTEDLIIIGFILQPLVENAVYHGIDIAMRNGVIKISAYCKEQRLFLEVQDNGVGMSRQKINKLFSGEAKPHNGMNSIGIRNVNERIKLNFGKEYGLEIFSTPGQGTIIRAVLPVIRGESY